MPITIGTKPSGGGDAIQSLLDCHERIRRFSSLATRLAVAPSSTPPAELADAARDVLRYFTVALPLHEQDEERSLMGRLPAGGDRLAAEHRAIEETLALLVPRWRAIEKDAAASRAGLETPSQKLEALFAEHLAWEETELFGAARKALSASALAEIAAEMRARRT